MGGGARHRRTSDFEEHESSQKSAVRLGSARLMELVGEHEAATLRCHELRASRNSYKASPGAARRTPHSASSIERYQATDWENHELEVSCARKIAEVEEQWARAIQGAKAPLLALAAEGMPTDVWIGIGDKEYVLLTCRKNGAPTLEPALSTHTGRTTPAFDEGVLIMMIVFAVHTLVAIGLAFLYWYMVV